MKYIAIIVLLAGCLGCGEVRPPALPNKTAPIHTTTLNNGQIVVTLPSQRDSIHDWLRSNKNITIISISNDFHYGYVVVYTVKAEQQ